MFRRILLYIHTLRYLTARQVGYRLWYRLSRPAVTSSPAPSVRPTLRQWTPGPAAADPFVSATRLRFLNQEHDVSSAGCWDDAALPRLWRYNLHYFDCCGAALDENRRGWVRLLMARWVRENPVGRGTGWEPYPLSLRIVNWVKWSLAGGELDRAGLESLACQARVLRRRLEHHLLANHLFANAQALVFAGCFFEGDEAEAWLRQGRELLREQLDLQVLADGGHCERSAMYHSVVLQGVLDVINLLATTGRGDGGGLREVAGRMLVWLAALTHPDGGIALFNDAVLDQGPAFSEFTRYAAALGIPARAAPGALVQLPCTGFGRAAAGPFVLLCECGGPGPSFQPGHAHAGTLGFELSCFGQRTVVDCGVSTYEQGPQRLAERGTASHNTLAVDSRDSSEVWAAFRLARRAATTHLRCEERGNVLVVDAGHDGWQRLGVAGRHRRAWELGPGQLRVVDTLEGRGEHEVSLGLLLHPDIAVRQDGEGRFELRHAAWSATLTVRCDPALQATLAAAAWHPQFAVSLSTSRMVCRARVALPFTAETLIGIG